MSLTSAPKDDPTWPPQPTETIPFTGREAQGLLARSKSRARVVAVGANGDLERALPMSDAEITYANQKISHRVLVLALIATGVSVTLSIVSSVVVWGAVARASEAASVVTAHLATNDIDQSISNMLGSISDVKATTGNAASMSESVEQATETIVTALNNTGQLISQFNEIADKLIARPQISFGIGGGR